MKNFKIFIGYFWIISLAPLIGKVNNVKKKPMKINVFYKKIFNLPSIENQIQLLKYRYRQKHWRKILSSLGIFEYSYQDDPLFKQLGLQRKSHEYSIYLINNFKITWFFKIYKQWKISQEYFKYQGQNSTIKKYKNQILSTLSQELDMITAPLEEENYKNQTILNNKLIEDKKTYFIGSKRQMEADIRQQSRLNNINVKNIQKKIYLVAKKSLTKTNFDLVFKSYNTLIKEKEVINYGWVKLLDFFSINIVTNKSINEINKNSPWQWSLQLNINRIPGFFGQWFVDKNKNSWKRIMKQRQLIRSKNKDMIRKKHHQDKVKRFQQLTGYRKNAMDILNKYDEYFVNKYKDNIYNNRYYYEFLITKNNYTLSFIRSNYGFIEYLWQTALKNPLTNFYI